MAKNTNDISIHFNHRVAPANHLTPEQVKSLTKELETISLKKFLNNSTIGFPEWVMLKGKNKEIAYIDTAYEDRGPGYIGDAKYKIVFEFPLSITVDEIRTFTESALRLFKNKFEGEKEFSSDGTFKVITKKPYKETVSSFAGLKLLWRVRSCADNKPYGTFSTRSEYFKKRNKWICDQYATHIKAALSSDSACDKIRDALALLTITHFGEWPKKEREPHKGALKAKGKSPLDLFSETIKDIIHRKS